MNFGAWVSVAVIDESGAHDGTQVTILRGEENGGTSKQTVERHVQTELRATVCTRPPFLRSR